MAADVMPIRTIGRRRMAAVRQARHAAGPPVPTGDPMLDAAIRADLAWRASRGHGGATVQEPTMMAAGGRS